MPISAQCPQLNYREVPPVYINQHIILIVIWMFLCGLIKQTVVNHENVSVQNVSSILNPWSLLVLVQTNRETLKSTAVSYQWYLIIIIAFDQHLTLILVFTPTNDGLLSSGNIFECTIHCKCSNILSVFLNLLYALYFMQLQV